MTKETREEVIKSIAIGATDKQIVDTFGLLEETVADIRANASAEIEETAQYLRATGWM